MKSAAKSESDAGRKVRAERPIQDAGIGRFAERLKEAMQGTSLRAFGKKCGLSEGALFSYLSGDTFPTLDRLDAIAAASGRAPGWFIGSGEANTQSQVLSQKELTIAVQLASEALEERNGTLPPAKFAELVTIIFELLRDGLPEAKVLRLARAMEGREGG